MAIVGRPFPKGVSGNPGGRPRKVSELKEQLERDVELAFEALRSALKSKSRKIRLEAAKLWLAYVYGQPSRETEREDKAFPFFQPLTEEQVQLAERMVKALPEDSDGPPHGEDANPR